MIDCDPSHPLNQIKDWKPWKPKKKRKKKKRVGKTRYENLTRLQRTYLLWARQNDLSLDRAPASADLGLQTRDCS